ncbi:MAG TPA: polysaccharide biosynthesis tyrosine autokinase [Vicinamibacterales bacterium]|nr:polysaccharide biosynthesis tyrosine autokinase [Vicinamibacterales bacterium]
MNKQAASQVRRSPGQSFHPTHYFRVFYKRRWVAIPGFLLVFLTGAIDSVRTVPIYQASAQLMIEKSARRATTINTVLEERDAWYDDGFLPTQHKILQSRALSARVVEAREMRFRPEHVPPSPSFSLSIGGLFNAAQSGVTRLMSSGDPQPAPVAAKPEAQAALLQSANVSEFQGGLTIAPIRASSLVEIRYRSPDPEYAAWAANEVANQYKLYTLESRLNASKEANSWLSDQLKEQRAKVDTADRALQQYKETNNASAGDERQNIVLQKLTAIQTQVVDARFELVGKEAVYQQFLALQRDGKPVDSLPAIVGNEAIQAIKTNLATLRDEHAKLTVQFGDKMPQVIASNARIKQAESELQSSMANIVASVESEYRAAAARVQSLEGSLNQQKGEAMGLDRKMMAYGQLNMDAKSERQLYEKLLEQFNEGGVSGEFKGSNIQVVDPAETPQGPILPQVQRDLMMSAFGGFVLALVLAFGFEYFDSRLKSPDEVKQHLDLPFLGMIPAVSVKEAAGEAPMLQDSVPPAFAEAIRALRTAILFSSADEGSRSLVITSTGPHEGKTLVSSSLAITLAQAGQKTLVIDADMRRPRMHEALGRPQEPGLSNVLVGDAKLSDASRATSVPNLTLLAAGHIPPNPAELLGSKKYVELLAQLGRMYDWVVIDAPPVMPVTDAALVAHTAGGVLFVVGSEMTPRQNAAAAIEQLKGANAKFVGVVLNRVNIQRHSYYYSPYYRKEYGKYYQRSASKA